MKILEKALYNQLFRSLLATTILFVVTACNHQSNQVTDDTSDTTTGFDNSVYVGKPKNPTIDWIAVNAGSYVFGSPEDTPCRAAYKENQSNVKLTHSFEMAATEVTQAQWQALGLKIPTQQVDTADAPIVLVNFFEVMQWMNALSKLEGLDSCYDLSSCQGAFGKGCPEGTAANPPNTFCSCELSWEGGCENSPDIYYCFSDVHKYNNWYECPGYRLPTTAEWEYAARAGTTTHTYYGDLKECIEGDTDYDNCSASNFELLDSIAWFRENSGGNLHPVAQKQPNPWGFYDILGNVFEWVDYFSDGQPLDSGDGHKGEDLVDPLGPREGKNMDLRGQSFKGQDCYIRTARQFYGSPDERRSDSGFRPVRTLFE